MKRALWVQGAGGLLAAVLVAGASPDSTGAERYEADLAASRVVIDGTSTLHDWHAEGRHVEGYVLVQEHELAGLWGASDDPAPHELAPTVRVEIPVASLASGTRGMDRKMREALKADTYPLITYRLESAQHAVHQTAQTDHGSGSLTIETRGVLMVAGVERPVDIPMRIRRLTENRLEISGGTSVRMTEFGVDPPRAMLGTLRAGDTVHVRWAWVLTRGRVDARHVR